MNSHWVPGNRITLLENGEGYYPRVFAAIAAARQEVLLETFILFDDKVGRQLQQALLSAAARGAAVHVLVDGWGSPDLPASFTRPLLDAGVRLRSFEPAQRLFGARINLLRRMHHKLVVVDGQRAFVGGINYSIDHLAEHGPLAKQDYAVEIEGPLVGQVQAFCRANVEAPQPARRQWLRRWRAGLRRKDLEAPAGEGALAAFVTRDNHAHRTDIERHYRAAIRSASERILIANAYFFPGYRLLRDLRRAARRGVQVDLILQGRPDMVWVKRASELLYRHLMRAGVRIHEYTERPLHGKVAVVDDRWATVGSSNLDPTSLSLNLEANVIVRDEAFARHLRERLDELLETCCERVELPTPGRLLSAWIVLRSMVVFHALRRFPDWTRRSSRQAPRVVPMQPEQQP
ncbi:MAG: cardiolipin synthase ClsB [Hydrogenophaga sp.]|uniref:cardiolipin synthase ClsB n=1 Tax=Hydrogenophaga sp. TaxID=1904254 RepID=UPI0026323453|nr:cardiolipin synthase ClsB [Hydrogenophaga sp.]MCV0440543.1 cardiolipin synthase ClsB [Hydrogenophaga sp.]